MPAVARTSSARHWLRKLPHPPNTPPSPPSGSAPQRHERHALICGLDTASQFLRSAPHHGTCGGPLGEQDHARGLPIASPHPDHDGGEPDLEKPVQVRTRIAIKTRRAMRPRRLVADRCPTTKTGSAVFEGSGRFPFRPRPRTIRVAARDHPNIAGRIPPSRAFRWQPSALPQTG